MLKAVIFDVDGTLAETEEWHRRAFNLAFVKSGLAWHWDEKLYAGLLKVTGGKERISHYIMTSGSAALDAAAIAQLHAEKNQTYAEFVALGMMRLRPGIADIIEQARAASLTLAIATTTSMVNVEALLGNSIGAHWKTYFAAVITGEMVAAKKPAPDAYLQALDALGCRAGEAVAIEDSRNGLLAARAAGLRTICLRSQYCAADNLSEAVRIFEDGETLTLSDILALAGEPEN